MIVTAAYVASGAGIQEIFLNNIVSNISFSNVPLKTFVIALYLLVTDVGKITMRNSVLILSSYTSTKISHKNNNNNNDNQNLISAFLCRTFLESESNGFDLLLENNTVEIVDQHWQLHGVVDRPVVGV